MNALVLSGGAAWGLAHVGVLEVLLEEEIPIDLVVGTSVGAIVGAIFAAGISIQETKQFFASLSWSDVGKITVPSLGFADSTHIETVLEGLIGDNCQFADLLIPLKIIATDVLRGEQVVLEEGRVAWAARASSSIPVVFTPVEYQDTLLVDGGVVNNLPVDVAREAGADRIIAVELVRAFPQAAPKHLVELGLLSYNIVQKSSMRRQAEDADVLLQPNLKDIHSSDLSAHEELFAAGWQIADGHRTELRALR